MKKLKILLVLIGLMSLTGCQWFIDQIDDKEYDVINLDGKNLSLVFSHNINGETHPCGCRHFPLGGLPQVAGQLEKLRKKNEVIYVDTGDMIFPSVSVPKIVDKSLSFTANGIFQAVSKQGLNYFVPGDQDLAKGVDYLASLLKGSKVKLLVANLVDEKKFPHKKWVKIEKGPHAIFLVGIVHPSVYQYQYQKLFKDPVQSLKEVVEKLKKDEGYDEKSPFHRLVMLSHAGRDNDEKLAKAVPQFDWIIGAHSQSFIRNPIPEGKTNIVQVLSRNHYLGEIEFRMDKDKKSDQYNIHEIRDELKDELKPNPYLAFIDKHKEELNKIQSSEQQADLPPSDNQMKTSASCMECHDDQVAHWQKTPHSMAFATLLNAKEEKNMQCIGCHSVGLKDPNGYQNFHNIVRFDGKQDTAKKEKYWKEVSEAFGKIESVRKLSAKELKGHAVKWQKIDEKHKVTHNYANVQCLNCHDQDSEHPFSVKEKQSKASMQKKCLECHDPDQSPEWYFKKENGLPGDLNQKVLDKHFKAISCPKA
ncbi:MAG: hypothetical protein GY909_03600 [Oligoflexia bacterium]|nr:hypothetical protein [Oligoflexia bacterium]